MLTYEANFRPRPDGRCTTSLAAWRQRLEHQMPELAFTAAVSRSLDTFLVWRQNVIAKYRELLRMPAPDPAQPSPRLLKSEPRDGYTLEHWEAYPDAWTAVPFLMLRPSGIPGPLPAVFCIPGSHHSKESLAGEPLPQNPNCPPITYPDRNCQALHFVKQGYLALAFDNPGTATVAEADSDGEQTQWSGRVRLVEGLLFSGTTYLGLSVFQKLNILDWLATQPEIDLQRLAVCGHSLGSEAAMALGLLDDRFSAVIFNDFVCDTQKRWTSITEIPANEYRDSGNWHTVPGQWRYFAFQDLLAAMAPKYLACNEGGAEEFLDVIRSAYALNQASDRLQITYYPAFAETQKHHEALPLHGLDDDAFTRIWSAIAPQDHSFRSVPSLAFLKRVFGK